MKQLLQICLLFFVLAPAAAQTVNINKAENAGDCSFTAVNATNSVFKVACGGKGLKPSEAKELSQILSMIKKDDLQFSRVLQSLRALAEEQKAEASKPKVQNCPDGFCNAGPVQAPQTINDNRQFRASAPAPEISQSSAKVAANKPLQQRPNETKGEFQSRLVQNRALPYEPLNDHPGMRVFVKVTERFSNPAFTVTCDKPCVPTKEQIMEGQFVFGTGGLRSSNEFQVSNSDPRIVLFRLGDTSAVRPGQTVILTVRSIDEKELESAVASTYVE